MRQTVESASHYNLKHFLNSQEKKSVVQLIKLQLQAGLAAIVLQQTRLAIIITSLLSVMFCVETAEKYVAKRSKNLNCGHK